MSSLPKSKDGRCCHQRGRHPLNNKENGSLSANVGDPDPEYIFLSVSPIRQILWEFLFISSHPQSYNVL